MRTIEPKTETEERLLNAAQSLMLEKGFVATTVDEICEAAGVTKGSFFHYFKSKEDLGKKLVQRFASKTGSAMKEGVCCAGNDPLDRVYGYLDCAIELMKNPDAKGCLVGTFSQELSESHPEIRSLCAQAFEEMVEMFQKDLAEAKEKYAPESKFDAASLAETFIAIGQGSMILMKAKKDRMVLARTLTHFRQYLKSLFGR